MTRDDLFQLAWERLDKEEKLRTTQIITSIRELVISNLCSTKDNDTKVETITKPLSPAQRWFIGQNFDLTLKFEVYWDVDVYKEKITALL